MVQLIRIIPGILLCLAAAIPAWFFGRQFPIIGGPVFGMLIGMLLIQFFPDLLKRLGDGVKYPSFQLGDGVKYTSKKLLQYSIILLGFGMNLFQVIKVGGQSLMVIVFTLTASFLTAWIIGKALKMESSVMVLVGVGTSICGGSAIAATAPVIQAKDEEVAHAISTIFLFNILAVFLFPAFGRWMGMSDTGFGMWAGTAINDTSSVVAAATVWSNAAGNNSALAFATIVKLTRTLMIIPITLVLAIRTSIKARKAQNESVKAEFQLRRIFPWFIIGFVAAAILNTVFVIPSLSETLVAAGKFMIIMAMTAIGLNTNLKQLLMNGFRPIFLGLCCWFSVAAVSIVIQSVMGLW